MKATINEFAKRILEQVTGEDDEHVSTERSLKEIVQRHFQKRRENGHHVCVCISQT